MNLKFYLISTVTFLASIVIGFFAGTEIVYNMLFPVASDPYAEVSLGIIPYVVGAAFLGSIIGFAVALIIIHKLGKRWGSQLNFGGHPVLKLTSLSFLTFLGLLFLLLLFYPSK